MSLKNLPWVVQKFGGSALRDSDSLKIIADIVKDYSSRQRVAIITSALYGVTDRLEALIQNAVTSKDDLQPGLDAILALHAQWVERYVKDAGREKNLLAIYHEVFQGLSDKLKGIRMLGHCPDNTRAEILVCGELLSSRLLAAHLQEVLGEAEVKLCPKEALKAETLTEAAHTLNASFSIDRTQSALKELLENTRVLVAPGFVATTKHDQIVTLGRNGSDYSATGLAAALEAEKCQIWKDVDGIFTADPRIVPNSKVLDEVSFTEAMELSYFGAKVINAKSLVPLTENNIPCEIRNFLKPEYEGTLVHAQIDENSPMAVKGVTHREGVSSITLYGLGLRGMVGFTQRATDAIARQGISIILVIQSSSEYSLTLCVQSEDVQRALDALKEDFYFELQQHLMDDILVHHERAVVSLVGEGMKHKRGVAARFLEAIASARVNVEIIAQGSTESAIALVVDENAAPIAVKAAHSAFFAEQMPLDVILMGCGTVGSALLEQIHRQQEYLSKQHIGLTVRAIARSKVMLKDVNGIDLSNWRESMEKDAQPYTFNDIVELRKQYGLLNPVIVDCTTDENLSRQYVDYLQAGFHVVTANKKANTLELDYYELLRNVSRRNFRKFLYETNVGAGLPVLDTLQSLIRSGDKMKGFQGILSGSLSLIMGLLQDGMKFSEAVLKAKDMGFTEPDPRDDLSGMDVGRKLLIIAREVGLNLELDDVEIEAMTPAWFNELSVEEALERLPELDTEIEERIAQAKSEGKILRYVGSIEGTQCRVGFAAVDPSEAVASVRDGENVIALNTHYYDPKPLVLRGYGAGAEVTAAGLFGDMLRTLRSPSDL